MDEWMTVKEAAQHFKVSESYIRRHLKKGWLDSYHDGYPLRLNSSEVDVFVLPFDSL